MAKHPPVASVTWLDPLPHRVGDLTYLAKRNAKDTEVFALAYALAKRRKHEFFPFAGTDLVVEGYPRSANTFMLNALKWSNPELRYASHLHACGSIKHAARKKIPMIVLIREPRAAALSLALREGLRLDYCFEWYLKYYKCVAAHRSSLVLADFRTVTTHLDSTYEELRSTYALPLRKPPTEPSELDEVKQQVVRGHRRLNSGGLNPLAVAVPTPEKRDAAAQLEPEIGRSLRLTMLLDSCIDLYHDLGGLDR